MSDRPGRNLSPKKTMFSFSVVTTQNYVISVKHEKSGPHEFLYGGKHSHKYLYIYARLKSLSLNIYTEILPGLPPPLK